MNFHYETDRLILRVCNRRDARAVHDFYVRNLRDFAKYEPIDERTAITLRYYESLLDIEHHLILEGDLIRYYLFERVNPLRVIGTVSFRNLERSTHLKCCTVGYKIDGEHRRLGYATEALLFLCHMVLTEEHMHRIEAFVQTDNEASCRLLEGIGFVREGLARRKILLQGAWRDHYLYGLLAD